MYYILIKSGTVFGRKGRSLHPSVYTHLSEEHKKNFALEEAEDVLETSDPFEEDEEEDEDDLDF